MQAIKWEPTQSKKFDKRRKTKDFTGEKMEISIK